MRILLTIFLILFLCSCTNFNSSNIAPGYKDAFISVTNYFIGIEDNLTPDLINEIPYASAVLKIGRGPRGLIILESIESSRYNWVSADGIIITTNQYGKIISTEGLINNLKYIESSYEDFRDLDLKAEYTSYYTYSLPTLNLLPINTAFNIYEEERVDLLRGSKNLTQIDEIIYSPILGWKSVNSYWIDEEGFGWKSKQYISPKLPPFYLEITKKPAI